MTDQPNAYVLLEDGTRFDGISVGADGLRLRQLARGTRFIPFRDLKDVSLSDKTITLRLVNGSEVSVHSLVEGRGELGSDREREGAGLVARIRGAHAAYRATPAATAHALGRGDRTATEWMQHARKVRENVTSYRDAAVPDDELWRIVEDASASATERAGGILVACETNPIDAVWKDRPGPPVSPAMPHALTLAGVKSETKRLDLADGLKKAGAEAAIITLADSVCWLLNIRGHDVPHTPFTLAFAILHDDGSADLFLDPAKRTPELIAHLGNSVQLHSPADFVVALDAMKGKTVLADPATAASAIFDRLKKAGAVIRPASDPCQLPKACKNPQEVEGMRKAHVRDGVAMVRFLAWLETHAATGELTEIEAAEALEGFRRATGCLSDVSFDTISGAGSNGAIVHYRVTRKTNRVIGKNEMFLVDSGAQYPDGTTDVTRTVMVGEPTAEMRDRFTRVLKGHIALATARFPDGTIGMQLDSLARRPLWEAGLDYDHGTGHGVGSYLSVHEGPQNISKRPVSQPLMPGMICSNEPGYYKTGEYGIRIENLVVVTEPKPMPDGERPMMGFETITLAPIDLNLVEPGLLTDAERTWLNAYHARVLETLRPLVDEETRAWLETATRAV